MRKITIGALAALVVVLMVLSVIPQTTSEDTGGDRGTLKTIYKEDFNYNNGGYSAPVNWYWTGSYWQWYRPTSGSQISWCYSPTIDLSAGTKNGEISFRCYGQLNFILHFHLEISKDNGMSWTSIHTCLHTGWNSHTVSFADDFLVSSFKLRFGGGDLGYGWSGWWSFAFDDVDIKAESGIPATVDIQPTTLNLDSMGNYVNIKVEDFPENPEYSPVQVDRDTVEIEGIGVDLKFGTWNENKFICKADRLLVEDAIGTPGDAVELAVSGDVGDTSFEGIATLRAIQH